MEAIRRGVQEGMTVRARDGEKVGKVRECSADGFLIEKGLFVPKDYLARYDLVTEIRDGEVWLSKTVAEFGTGAAGGLASGTRTERAQTDRELAGRESERGEVRIPVTEEELEATKRVHQAGEVRVHKEVTTEQRELSVPVTTERVVVERVPVSGQAARTADANFKDETISIPVREEEVEVRKRPVVREEVRLRKERGVREERVADTVRKEHVEVEDTTDENRRIPSEPGGYKAPGKE